MRAELVIDDPSYAAELESKLAQGIDGEVRFDRGSRGAYSTDGSNYRQFPIGVVVPKSIDDVVSTINICREFGAPITSRGGGTSLAGQCCNVSVVVDWTKYLYHVKEIDPERRIAHVEPGCVLDRLRHEAQEKHGLTFGPDPATHDHCTLGGMIGNNSCGVHSVMAEFYGPGPRTQHNVAALDVLTYGGARFTVGATNDRELERILEAGGPQSEIYRQLVELRDRYAELIRSRFSKIPRRVSGYNLEALLPENGFDVAQALVGTEGTCVTVLSAKLKLLEAPKTRSLLVLGYPDVYAAADHVMQVRAHKPIGLEGIDDKLINYMRRKGVHPNDIELLPEGNGWLLIEFAGDTREEADDRAKELMAELKRHSNAPTMKLFDNPWEEKKVWEIRESGLSATAHVPSMPEAYPGWEDAAVPPENVGSYLRQFRTLLEKYGYDCALYGHFGQGCIHCRITFDLKTNEGISSYVRFINEAADLVVSLGGALSGEHGDGQSRAALLEKMYGSELLDAFRRFKSIWDPTGRMNPGKVVDPYPPDANLKFSPHNYHPKTVETHFRFPSDQGSFVKAANRCVGVGKCRRENAGTMCPSYMATREEIHSTRGRSRLLFEMLEGDVVADGWRDKHVHEALDMCLACKGCKHECPVNVDMATYKSEFLSHFYAGRLRPRTAYTMGWIYWWARLASRAPRIANFFSHTWPFSSLAKFVAGVAPQRRIPAFANVTFADWFRSRSAMRPPGRMLSRSAESFALRHEHVPRFQTDTYSDADRDEATIENRLNPHAKRARSLNKRVLLWPDTFTNYLKPEAGKAAVEVLEDAGFVVHLPPRPLCCGRPLYDWGMLSEAKKLWRQTMDVLADEINAGTPLVGLEPSCVAAFRDELKNLFPGEGLAGRLSRQTYLLSEFLEQEGYEPPVLHRKALVHGHCHHKAIMHMDAEIAILKKLQLDYELLDSGCCGMAGAFGFEKKHYDVSIACGERVLLPAVREASDDTLIIANGFSCAQQIEQCTGRKVQHLAEVLKLALDLDRLRGAVGATDDAAPMSHIVDKEHVP
ncbi:MAG TPA: FAD-binding and (Fe-S)-binding domain-containing protein [Lacipirellulaceae bacterium]|nr:FAD-binding and (Fe-S)-binding domain-containing protein [Lacipirellulaceae bacterium]